MQGTTGLCGAKRCPVVAKEGVQPFKSELLLQLEPAFLELLASAGLPLQVTEE